MTTKYKKNNTKVRTRNTISYFRNNFVFRSRLAFSLMELLMVMAIIGIMSAVVVIGSNAFIPSWRLTSSSKAVLSKIRQAQEEAVTTQKQTIIRFDPATTPVIYQLIKNDGGETVLESGNLAPNITLALDAAFADNQVAFSADGGPSASGNIVISNNTANKTISISPAGVIKLQ